MSRFTHLPFLLLAAAAMGFHAGCNLPLPNSGSEPTVTTTRVPTAPLAPTRTRPVALDPTAVLPVETTFSDEDRALYMDSGVVRLGVDKVWGGAIREIWFEGQNLVNNYDGGRLIGVSFYDSNQPPASAHPADTGWNPTPSDRFDHINQPLAYSMADNEIYVGARYLQWYPDDKGGGPGRAVGTQVLVETWISFYSRPDTVRVTYRLTNEGQDSHANASQEFPFAYLRTPYHRYVTYSGNNPWTQGPVQPMDIPLDHSSGRLSVSPERWAGLVDSDDVGLVMWAPQSYGNFSYAGFDNPGPVENSTLYLLPRAFLEIGAGYSVETQVFLFLGRWQESRDQIYSLHQGLSFADIMPSFGTIDSPTPGATVSGTVILDGWAIDDRGVDRIEIRVDGETVGLAIYGKPRGDVDREYPGLPGAPNFALSYSLDTTPFANGLHTLEVLAVDTSGNASRLAPGKIPLEIDN